MNSTPQNPIAPQEQNAKANNTTANAPVKANNNKNKLSSVKQSNKNNAPTVAKSSLTKKVSLKYYRGQAVERTSKIVKILPQFIKFIKKLTPDQIAALKYYKGPGSFFQTDLIIHHVTPQENKKPGKQHELRFPFYKEEDEMMRNDILGTRVLLQYPLWLPNMSDIPSYINNSYGIRIKLLNLLDTVFSHSNCPKLTEDVILFRGMKNVPDARKIKAGETFTFNNFISTSMDRLIAERFSGGGYVFVFTGFKDVPCMFTPGLKRGNLDLEKYTFAVMYQSIMNDLSELTLPRGLEFKIDKVEKRHISERNFFARGNNYGKVLSALSKEGLAPDAVATTIEDVLYDKATFIYCSFVKWTPQQPISFKEIKKTAKFVLNMDALESWIPRGEKGFNDDDN